jgi:hypothetical protein
MVEGGPVDVLTGDYLAELTMALLWRSRMKDPDGGYASTFLRQMEEVLGICLDRGIKIVANAGGLNPSGLAGRLEELAHGLGLAPRIAHVEGDDVLPRIPEFLEAGLDLANLDTGVAFAGAGVNPVSANAYLGGWGIAAALETGADVVVTGRVTDAALVIGPAAWHHGWARHDWDALAGALVAGHVIECGAQTTGGNYSFFDEVPGLDHVGFPLVEVGGDGSFVVTKHPNTGGLVSTETVTAQLLYEIAGSRYLNPDVTARFDSIELTQDGPDRVSVRGIRGEPPPSELKVAMNYLGGFRNSITFVITGLDVDAKSEVACSALWEAVGGRDQFAHSDVRLVRWDRPDAASNELASAYLTVTVKDPDAERVGRRFSRAGVELALASYPGFYLTAPPGDASPYAVYWPTTIPADLVTQRVSFDGNVIEVPFVAVEPLAADPGAGRRGTTPSPAGGPTVSVPLGTVAGARSGDKGGNANVGLWVRERRAYGWLVDEVTVDRFKQLLPEAADLEVERHEFPNLGAINFVVKGLLGDGVSSSVRMDPQAKSLGEFLRSRFVEVPVDLMRGAPGGSRSDA